MSILTLLCLATAAVAYSDFEITSLVAYQPNGDPSQPSDCYNFSDQPGCYIVSFDVSRPIDTPGQSVYCVATWADNPPNCDITYEGCIPYATNAPTCWTRCWQDRNQGFDRLSSFPFRLSPYFSIGNFSIEMQTNVYEYVLESCPVQVVVLLTAVDENSRYAVATFLMSSPYLVSNSSAETFACEIEGGGTSPPSYGASLHAGGTCASPEGSEALHLPVDSTTKEYLGGYCTR